MGDLGRSRFSRRQRLVRKAGPIAASLLWVMLSGLLITPPANADETWRATPADTAVGNRGELAAQHDADMVLRDDAACTECHDESDPDAILAIGPTKHGTVADARTPTCTTCHGDSVGHIERKRSLRKPPDVVFRDDSPTPADDRNAVCLDCHRGKERMFWHSSAHASADVTCASCHDVHAHADKVRRKQTQAEVCVSCHTKQRMQITKPSRHPVLEGKVVCSDCHNPHGSAGPHMVARDSVNDTCFKCHTEKRGPFIWPHQPVTEDCATCHEPHGTTVASMLKWRAPFLCQQCHEPSNHPGNIPSFGSSGSRESRNITLARGCLNCHTNIHGSNNPLDSSASRSFRQ